jgi:phenylacetate-CoA ligase
MYGLVGGEGMTEALRDYCEQRFRRVLRLWRLDLTIGMGAESQLTVWLRDQIVADEALKADLLGPTTRASDGLPVQPARDLPRGHRRGRVVVHAQLLHRALTQTALQHRRRGRLLGGLEKLIARHPRHEAGFRAAQAVDRMKLPLLFLYGRADSTVSFMGANIYPDIEYGLYEDNPRAGDIEAFMLTLEEDAERSTADRSSTSAPEACTSMTPVAGPAACEQGIVAHLTAFSRDFKQSLEEDLRCPDRRARPLLRHRTLRGRPVQDQEVYFRKPATETAAQSDLMRSADFSKAPRIAQAGAMFTGATRYNGIPAWITLSWTWRKLVKRIRAMPATAGTPSTTSRLSPSAPSPTSTPAMTC